MRAAGVRSFYLFNYYSFFFSFFPVNMIKRAHAHCTHNPLNIRALGVSSVLCPPSEFAPTISPLPVSSGSPSLSVPVVCVCVCLVLRHACVIRPPSFMKCDASSTSSATTHSFTPTLQALSSSMPLSLSLPPSALFSFAQPLLEN